MTYYRVKEEYDNKVRYTWNNHHHGTSNGILVGGELYTPREYKKLANCPYWFDIVEVSKRKTYIAFGARFENKVV